MNPRSFMRHKAASSLALGYDPGRMLRAGGYIHKRSKPRKRKRGLSMTYRIGRFIEKNDMQSAEKLLGRRFNIGEAESRLACYRTGLTPADRERKGTSYLNDAPIGLKKGAIKTNRMDSRRKSPWTRPSRPKKIVKPHRFKPRGFVVKRHETSQGQPKCWADKALPSADQESGIVRRADVDGPIKPDTRHADLRLRG